MCHVTERATSVRTAGARGERSQRIVVGKWKRSGREESVAREREGSRGTYDQSREIERSDPRDGRGGSLEGSLEMIDTRTGITHGPLASTW